jgi:hypothetical protein
MSFTVTNVSGIPNRGLAKLAPMGNTNAEWLTLKDVEREFPVGGVHQFRVAANIPPGTPAGRYTLRFDVASALKRGEELDAGPTVAFEVPASEPPKKGIPWWVWLAIAIAAIVIAVVLYLVFRKPDPPPPPPPPEVVTVKVPEVVNQELASAIFEVQRAGLAVVLEPRIVDPDPRILIRPVNTVLEQKPIAGEEVEKGSNVILVVQQIRGTKFNPALRDLAITPETKLQLDKMRRAVERSQ